MKGQLLKHIAAESASFQRMRNRLTTSKRASSSGFLTVAEAAQERSGEAERSEGRCRARRKRRAAVAGVQNYYPSWGALQLPSGLFVYNFTTIIP